MHLVLFDIDGTLTQTNAVDDDCFIRAARDALGLARVEADWSAYPHVTDSGITTELIRAAFARPPRPGEIDAVRDRFVEYLRCAIEHAPSACRAVEGAAGMLSELMRREDTCIGLATGGWGASARMKLRAAGLALEGTAFASADDAMTREEIIQAAIARAACQREVERFESCVYVGDGLWDARTARALRIPFIGIAKGHKAAQLAAADALDVFQDFGDVNRFVRALFIARRARWQSGARPSQIERKRGRTGKRGRK